MLKLSIQTKNNKRSNSKVMRNSHNFIGGGYHNRSMIEPDPKWLLQSTDSDSFKHNQSLFADYPNGANSVQQTIEQRPLNSKGKSNSKGRQQMNTIDNSAQLLMQNQKTINQTIDGTYIQREDVCLGTRKTSKKNSIRQSADFTQLQHMNQKGILVSRPSSQLGNKSKDQVVYQQKHIQHDKNKSNSKNRALEELIQLQMREKER